MKPVTIEARKMTASIIGGATDRRGEARHIIAGEWGSIVVGLLATGKTIVEWPEWGREDTTGS
jgi:hypothetical protein